MNNNNSSPIVICGSGRSGTTWIMDVLAEANNLRTIFEPLLPVAVPEARPFANHYVRTDSDEPELTRFMHTIFKGQIDNIWTKYRIRKDSLYIQPGGLLSLKNINLFYSRYKKFFRHYRKFGKINSRRLLIKFIRANLMIGWLAKNFRVKILFVIRHPAAVACSKLLINAKAQQIIWDYKGDLQRYIQNRNLKNDYLDKYDDILNNSLSVISGYTVNWCIENTIPIKAAKENGVCVVFYEDLLANPETWWENIVNFLNLEEKPNKEIIIKPSQEAPQDMKNQKFGKNQIKKWTKYLSTEQKMEINSILEIFNVNFYNAFNPMPINKDFLN
ncbi:MAG: sulfotransferase [Promethearchaeota archaeon]|jgi:hypothetical protein